MATSSGRVEAPIEWRVVRHELRLREATVREVVRVTPNMARITFTGEDLRTFASADGSDHVKLFFPLPGERTLVPPERTETGISWPLGTPVSRDYTPGPYDAKRGELAIDFYLHGHGPGAGWAADARPGDGLLIGGPRGSRVLESAFDWYLLVGDETALPMIQRHLATLPTGSRAITVIGTRDAGDRQPLESTAPLDETWVTYDGNDLSPVLTAVRGLSLPPGAGFVRAAGEATMLRDVRRHLLNERGLDREHVSVNGHWKAGRSDFDHHEPIEE